jgi:Domain of unknown function (DUF4434)
MAAALAAPGPPPRLHGTFLQLWAAHKDWPDARWTELFGYLHDLGLREVVVQWSRYDAIDYRPEVERVLRAGFDVWMGLTYDSRWWQQPSPEMVRDAVRGASRLEGVRGYYLPHEIEAASWPGEQRALAEAIRSVRKQFHPLALSGFTNRTGSPAELARFWRTLQRRSKFDRLLFQDGIGSGKMPLADWPAWASPLARQLGRRLSIVVETFAAQGEGPTWQAQPADWPRIQEQLRLAAAASRNGILAFSAPEYMTPLGGYAATQLFHQVLSNRADTPQ